MAGSIPGIPFRGRHGDPKDVLRHALSDALQHLLEEVVGLKLVLQEGIFLADGPEAYAAPKLVHPQEVVLPLGVQDVQHEKANQSLAHLGPQIGHLAPEALQGPFSEGFLGRGQGLGGLHPLQEGFHPGAHHALEPKHRRPGLALPLLGKGLFQHTVDGVGDDFFHPLPDSLFPQDLISLAVDRLALLVHDVIVHEELAADVEVHLLHLFLGIGNGLGEHGVLDGFALFHAQLLHDALDALRAEKAQEVVFQGEVEAAGARISLAAATPPELVVDAPGLVALGAQDVKAPGGQHLLPLDGALGGQLPAEGIKALEVGGGIHAPPGGLFPGQKVRVAPQNDVRAAPRHIGGHRDGAEAPRLGHDLGFFFVELGVQHLMGDLAGLEELTHHFGVLDGGGAHQHRLPFGVTLSHLVRHSGELLPLGAVDQIGVILTDHGTVRGEHHHGETVDLFELLRFRGGGPRHTRQLAVHAEVVLDGHRGEGLIFPANAHSLFGLDGLVEAVGVPATEHEPTGELVHDDDLPVFHHVVHVALEKMPCLQGLEDLMGHLGAGQIGKEPRHLEDLFAAGDASFGEGHVAVLFFHLEVRVPGEAPGHIVGPTIGLHVVLRWSRDDEGRPGLVHQDGVHLVHDGEGMPPLYQVRWVGGHVVPQVVEAKFAVGAVGHVRPISGEALLWGHEGGEDSHGKPQEAIDGPHPLRVPLGQVVVHRHHVHALARKAPQGHRQGGYQGLPFAGFHLGDAPFGERHGSHELYVEVAQPHGAHGDLPHRGEDLFQQGVGGLSSFDAPPELVSPGPEGLIGEGLEGGLQGVDPPHSLPIALQGVLVGIEPQRLLQTFEHAVTSYFVSGFSISAGRTRVPGDYRPDVFSASKVFLPLSLRPEDRSPHRGEREPEGRPRRRRGSPAVPAGAAPSGRAGPSRKGPRGCRRRAT
ncbi:MAG: hypothetical protein BWY88_00243 [Synergistetes bacterium ADurb.Bin520]|nr:MAG: hypothetical protein BWY88_00243 [Synergistetes bacterium ADurb.Bin520]